MKRLFILVFTCIAFFAFTLGVASQVSASVSSDYVVFRANVAPMYILNESAPVQVLAIPFQNNKPVYATVQVHIQVTGLNVKYSFSSIYQLSTGQQQNIYLPAMKEGHYEIVMYAEYNGIESFIVKQDFGVVPAPLPYELYFNNDGSEIHFKSEVLNSTGQVDPNVTFTLQLYLWNGQHQTLLSTYQHITNLTIHVPQAWKNGILIVNVVDEYGWTNGMSINLQAFQFQGYPVEYDYQQSHRYPEAGRGWLWYVGVMVIVIVLLYIGKRVFSDGAAE